MSIKRDVVLLREHQHGLAVYQPGAVLRGLDAKKAKRLVDEKIAQYASAGKVRVSKEAEPEPADEGNETE